MSVKASVSISRQQDLFARKLVEEGRFASLSAVIQRGLELLREETEIKDAELAALKALIYDRMNGEFLTTEESNKQIEAMVARKKAELGL